MVGENETAITDLKKEDLLDVTAASQECGISEGHFKKLAGKYEVKRYRFRGDKKSYYHPTDVARIKSTLTQNPHIIRLAS